MNKIQRDGAVLCLPDQVEGKLFTVCCIADEGFGEELGAIWDNLPPVAALLIPPGRWEDLSPFPAPALREGDPDFTPGAEKVLNRAAETFEKLQRDFPLQSSPALAGYSLAGLTALYGLHAGWGKVFSAFGSMSGSLWMEGWNEFALSHPVPPEARVYLSLGGKEEKAGNPRMRRVGEATRAEVNRLKMQLPAKNLHFTLHPGGHFKDIPGRWEAAIRWLAEKEKPVRS